MGEVVGINDNMGHIETCCKDDEDIICDFCDHQFVAGEKFVTDINLCHACPKAAGGLSDKTCYAEQPALIDGVRIKPPACYDEIVECIQIATDNGYDEAEDLSGEELALDISLHAFLPEHTSFEDIQKSIKIYRERRDKFGETEKALKSMIRPNSEIEYAPLTACECTKVEQDETCPIGYPSLLCETCNGTGQIADRRHLYKRRENKS